MSTAGWPSTTGNPSGGGRDNNTLVTPKYKYQKLNKLR